MTRCHLHELLASAGEQPVGAHDQRTEALPSNFRKRVLKIRLAAGTYKRDR
jgi:hypothetical protein